MKLRESFLSLLLCLAFAGTAAAAPTPSRHLAPNEPAKSPLNAYASKASRIQRPSGNYFDVVANDLPASEDPVADPSDPNENLAFKEVQSKLKPELDAVGLDVAIDSSQFRPEIAVNPPPADFPSDPGASPGLPDPLSTPPASPPSPITEDPTLSDAAPDARALFQSTYDALKESPREQRALQPARVLAWVEGVIIDRRLAALAAAGQGQDSPALDACGPDLVVGKIGDELRVRLISDDPLVDDRKRALNMAIFFAAGPIKGNYAYGKRLEAVLAKFGLAPATEGP